MDKQTAAGKLKINENRGDGAFAVERTDGVMDSVKWYIANRWAPGQRLYLWDDDHHHITPKYWPTEADARVRLDRYIQMLRCVAGQPTCPTAPTQNLHGCAWANACCPCCCPLFGCHLHQQP